MTEQVKKAKVDNFARILSGLSLIIAVVAILVPYYQQVKELKENVLITVNPLQASGRVIFTKHMYSEMGQVIQVPFYITISNTGSRKISLTRYFIYCYDKYGLQQYSGIDGGLVTAKGEPIYNPITLDGGDTISGFIYTGILVPEKVAKYFVDIKDKTNVDYRELKLFLAKKGTDIYGNKVDYKDYGGNSYTLRVGTDQQNAPTYLYDFVTGREQHFQSNTSLYSIENFK